MSVTDAVSDWHCFQSRHGCQAATEAHRCADQWSDSAVATLRSAPPPPPSLRHDSSLPATSQLYRTPCGHLNRALPNQSGIGKHIKSWIFAVKLYVDVLIFILRSCCSLLHLRRQHRSAGSSVTHCVAVRLYNYRTGTCCSWTAQPSATRWPPAGTAGTAGMLEGNVPCPVYAWGMSHFPWTLGKCPMSHGHLGSFPCPNDSRGNFLSPVDTWGNVLYAMSHGHLGEGWTHGDVMMSKAHLKCHRPRISAR